MYIGIEIGGTKLQTCIDTGDGALHSVCRATVDPKNGADGIRAQLLHIIPKLLNDAHVDKTKVKAIGIGFGGPVDDVTNRVIKSHQIDGWDDFPLANWFRDQFGLPAVVGNDADVAGLGEAHFGAGKELSPVFYITVGSGIGGGLIVDGEIYRGTGRGAAEIGHVRIHIEDERDDISAGYHTVESICSGWGMASRAQHALLRSDNCLSSLLEIADGDIESITGEHVGMAATAGDQFAQGILRFATEFLAEAICHVIALLCPKRIVIGGGVSQLGNALFFDPLRARVTECVFAPFAGCFDIMPAALGEDVVLYGAIALAQRAYQSTHGNGIS